MSGMLGSLKRVEITEGGIVGKTDKDSGHYQTKRELSGGGILMEWGCHTLSQLTKIMSKYQLTVKDAAISYVDSLDIEVEAMLKAQDKKESVPISYKVSLAAPMATRSRYICEGGEIVFNHANPESLVRLVVPSAAKNPKVFTLMPGKRGASTFYQAFYLRWMDILGKVRGQLQFDTPKETSLKTTELITEMYRRGK